MRKHGIIGWIILVLSSALIYLREHLVSPKPDPTTGAFFANSSQFSNSQSLLLIGFLFGLLGIGLVLIDAFHSYKKLDHSA